MSFSMLNAAALTVGISIASSTVALSRGEWPNSPNKAWFENLQRPDNHLHPYRDPTSLYCCGEADVVRTKFKVEGNGGPHPEDTWYAWLNETWVQIPPEKIVKDFSPTGEALLFVLAGTIQCFVPPKGGL
jgi:hypothetical protein